MLKVIFFVFMVIACACAKPKPDVIAYSAPLVAAPLATSSAVISREFHGNTAPYLAAYSAYPYAYSAYSAYAAPYVASPYAAYTAPVLL